jgi:hypothetical protein
MCFYAPKMLHHPKYGFPSQGLICLFEEELAVATSLMQDLVIHVSGQPLRLALALILSHPWLSAACLLHIEAEGEQLVSHSC